MRDLRRHPLLRALPLALLLLAACPSPPELLPPPYGPDTTAPQPARLFWPTGMALAPSGHLLVVNGNFNHAFDFGSVVTLDPGYLTQMFEVAPPDPTDVRQPVPVDIPNGVNNTAGQNAFLGNAIIGNYGGPLTITTDANGIHAYTGSRDTSHLNGVNLDPKTGKLSCINGKGPADYDCRDGIVDLLANFGVEGPYSIVPGVARLPGSTIDTNVLFVPALIPSVDRIENNTLFTKAPLAALYADNPSAALFVSDAAPTIGGIGAGPAVFDQARRQLILGGCYTRYPSGSVGDPSSAKCSTRSSNLLRFIGVDEGSDSQPQVVDISQEIKSSDTVDMALGNVDPATGLAQTLFVATRAPDLLVELDLPSDPLQLVAVRKATSMPVAPAQILRLRRPDASPGHDLLLVSSEFGGSISVYDQTAGQVVAEVERLSTLGASTFAMVQLPDKGGDGPDAHSEARVAVSVFGDCRVALIDVNYDRPWQARLRARLGSCPQ